MLIQTESTRSPALPSPEFRPVASPRHTMLLAGIFLALAVAGGRFQHQAAAHPGAATLANLLPLYASLIAMELLLVWTVWRATRRTGTSLRELVGGRWAGPRDVLVDVALAAALWATWTLLTHLAARVLPLGDAAQVTGMLPRGVLPALVWVVVSLSAGFSEELVFRGYFQRQFAAWTRNRWLALALQALLFGVSHGYQGAQACGAIAIYGALFGLLALWRGSLRPGMMAHAATDIVSGLMRI